MAYVSDYGKKRTVPYRAYDADGVLLYAGISCNPDARIYQHRKSEWWHMTDEISLEWFDNRSQAAAAERRAIAEEDPIYNVARPIRMPRITERR